MIVWRESAKLLRRCLASVAGQGADQIIVAKSSEASDSASLRPEFPGVEWIERSGPADLPELQWLALERVQSDLVAFLEAPSIAGPGWIAAHRQAHLDQTEVLACGGPVRPPQGGLGWRHGWYWSDYASYSPGRAKGTTRNLTDANVSYKTSELRRHEAMLSEGAWGWRLRQVSPSPSFYEPLAWIDYPGPHTFGDALRHRYSAGQAHGAVANLTGARRMVSVVTAPLLPVLLAWRDWKAARRAGCGSRYALALPWTVIFYAYWACGELAGVRSRY